MREGEHAAAFDQVPPAELEIGEPEVDPVLETDAATPAASA
jgi:hypothetical protein